MGIFSRLKNKKQKEQLEAVQKPNVQAAKKPAAKKDAKAEEKKPAAKKPAAKKATTSSAAPGKAVLLRALVSEKAAMAEASGKYTFVVSTDATKLDVKRAVKDMYNVNPKSVRMMNMEGKRTRFGRYMGRRADWKKAIVTLPKGQSITIHEGV